MKNEPCELCSYTYKGKPVYVYHNGKPCPKLKKKPVDSRDPWTQWTSAIDWKDIAYRQNVLSRGTVFLGSDTISCDEAEWHDLLLACALPRF